MDPRRGLPSVERVLASLPEDGDAHHLRVRAARDAVATARRTAGAREPDGGGTGLDAVVADAQALLDRERVSRLGPVVNATGVLLHTNLGRAPIGEDALAAMNDVAGYANLEYRLDRGVRGSRHDHAGDLVAAACGAESGIVVNNNAAAVLLCLASLARDREVVVSRGELVEIGGGFRVPEILAETGARLVEVGTTNRTRRSDYAAAVRADTALVLKVHASNYRMIGFTEDVAVSDLSDLGPPVLVDAGSGLLDATTPWLGGAPPWLRDEPGVRQCLDAGAALVTFSGDKLLGGPQAGLVVGRSELVDRLVRHPLARAVRADKLTLAGIRSVALAYLSGSAGALPLWHMATTPTDALRARAESIRARLGELHADGEDVDGHDHATVTVVETEAVAGGGSLPGRALASVGLRVGVRDAREAHATLRRHRVVARVNDGAVVVDLRTVDPDDDPVLVRALTEVVATGSAHDAARGGG